MSPSSAPATGLRMLTKGRSARLAEARRRDIARAKSTCILVNRPALSAVGRTVRSVCQFILMLAWLALNPSGFFGDDFREICFAVSGENSTRRAPREDV